MRGTTLNAFLKGQSGPSEATPDHLFDLIERFAKVAIKLRIAIQEGALGAAFAGHSIIC